MKDAIEGLGLSMEDVNPKTHSLAEVFRKLDDAGADSADTLAIAGQRGGPALQNLLDQGAGALEDYTQQLKDSDGAAEDMADTMQDNLQGSLKQLMSALQETALTFYDSLREPLTDAVDWITDLVRSFADMSDGMKKFVLAVGGITAVAGPVLVVLGALSAAIGAISAPVAITVGALAGLGVGLVALAKKFSEPIEKTDEFSDKVSESTKESLESYGKLRDEAAVKLTELSQQTDQISSEMADGLVDTYSEMGDEVIKEIENNHKERLELLQGYSEDLHGVTEAQWNDIMNTEQDFYDKQKEDTRENEKRKQEIIKSAKDENRELKRSELAELHALQTEDNERAAKTMSDSRLELKSIREDMKTDATTLSAKQAAQVAKDANEQADNVISEANEEYEKTKLAAWRMYEEIPEFSAKQRDQMISQAKNERGGVVGEAETMRNRTINEAKNKAKGVADQVDWEKGEVLTTTDKIVNFVTKHWKSLKNDTVETTKFWTEKISGFFHNLSYSVGTIISGTVDTVTGYWDNLSDDVVETTSFYTQEIPALIGGMKDDVLEWISETWTSAVDTTKSMLGNMKDKVVEKFNAMVLWIQGFPKMVGEAISKYAHKAVDGVKDLAGKIKDKFTDLLGIHSPSTVFEGFGKFISEGLVNGLSVDGIKEFGMGVLQDFKGGIFSSWDAIKDFFSGTQVNISDTLGMLKDMGGDVAGDLGGWISKALSVTGAPSSWAGPLATIAQHESGGKTGPSTINTWDSNAAKGTPSMGVMQTIGPTFEANKVPGLGGIMDPTANIAAAINYIKGRYGNPMNTPGLRSMAQGGDYKGYAQGGLTDNEWAWVGENGPELMRMNKGNRVYSAPESRSIVNNQSSGSDDAIRALAGDVRNIYRELKGRSGMSVELNGEKVGRLTEPYIDKYAKKRERKKQRGRGENA